jgi:acyl-CoA synthetase (AMP-forming)/AMP-acid ligase II
MKIEKRKFETLIDLLEYRATFNPNMIAISFFENGEIETDKITYLELYSKASILAEHLFTQSSLGKTVLIIQNSSIDYLVSFFAVIMSGRIPVPAYPPRNNRNSQRMKMIIEDTKSDIILTTLNIKKTLDNVLADPGIQNSIKLLCVDEFYTQNAIQNYKIFRPDISDISFLQYTSGSTGNPKGVVINHKCLLANLTYIWEERLSSVKKPKMVSWLPLFHDMGLIGGVLTPLLGNFPTILMPPVAFLQKPFRWLKVISEYLGSISPAPNFAYELCNEKISLEKRNELELSSWQMVLNGSEKVRIETIQKFSDNFAASGFKKNAFAPCYGLAEATLMVSSVCKDESPKHLCLEKEALKKNVVKITNEKENVISIVSCGKPLSILDTIIVDSNTGRVCTNNEIGEVWVKGISIAGEYWEKAETSKATFANRPLGFENGEYLKTGDLGFLLDCELYITGRIKNLIIIGGQNFYAQDIEKSIEYFSNFFRKNGSAAFSIEKNNQENLVIVAEVERNYWNKWKKDNKKPETKANEETNPLNLLKLIRRNISEEFAIQISDLIFIKPGKLPKTTSGKIQHLICKKKYIEGDFEDCSLKIR